MTTHSSAPGASPAPTELSKPPARRATTPRGADARPHPAGAAERGLARRLRVLGDELAALGGHVDPVVGSEALDEQGLASRRGRPRCAPRRRPR